LAVSEYLRTASNDDPRNNLVAQKALRNLCGQTVVGHKGGDLSRALNRIEELRQLRIEALTFPLLQVVDADATHQHADHPADAENS
jgi:hypothetical protein